MNPLPQSSLWILAALGLLCSAGTSHAQSSSAETTGQTTVSHGNRVRLIANQQYADFEGKEGACDVYLPAGKPPDAGYPCVIVVHGGGWISGDKWTVEGYGRVLAKAGIAAITVNYRLAPTHQFPVALDDVRQALVWAANNAGRLSIDCSRLGMFGYSAGGHLSLLTALTAGKPFESIEKTTSWAKDDPRWKTMPTVKAICAGGPPCDFRDLPPDNTTLSYFLGGSRREKPDVYQAASPITHVSRSAPPVQLIHGTADAIVSITNSQAMLKALQAAGVDARMETVANHGHMLTFLNSKTSETMLTFFQESLGE